MGGRKVMFLTELVHHSGSRLKISLAQPGHKLVGGVIITDRNHRCQKIFQFPVISFSHGNQLLAAFRRVDAPLINRSHDKNLNHAGRLHGILRLKLHRGTTVEIHNFHRPVLSCLRQLVEPELVHLLFQRGKIQTLFGLLQLRLAPHGLTEVEIQSVRDALNHVVFVLLRCHVEIVALIAHVPHLQDRHRNLAEIDPRHVVRINNAVVGKPCPFTVRIQHALGKPYALCREISHIGILLGGCHGKSPRHGTVVTAIGVNPDAGFRS